MALGLQSIYKNCVRQFHTDTSDERMMDDFIDAVNSSLDEMSDAADLDSAIAHVTSYSSTIEELVPKDTYILMAGISFYLVLWGWESVRGDNSYSILKGEWEEKKGQFMVNKSHSDQDSVEDNLGGEGATIIGLGDVTDIDRTGD